MIPLKFAYYCLKGIRDPERLVLIFLILFQMLLSFMGKGLVYHGNCDPFRGKARQTRVWVEAGRVGLRSWTFPALFLVFLWRRREFQVELLGTSDVPPRKGAAPCRSQGTY